MFCPKDQLLDIVIFGATGFTGRYAVNEVIRFSKNKVDLSWGIAGRNIIKLEELIRDIGKKTGEDLSAVKIIVADIMKYESLQGMVSSARVVVNCAGPYRFYGEPVVKACIENGTHHIDVSGEPFFMEKMQQTYHKVAEEKGVYVVSACGFDSIPVDMGTVFLQQELQGTVNSVETYWQIDGPLQNFCHYGTWASMVNETAHFFKMSSSLKKLIPDWPTLNPKLKLRSLIHRTIGVEGWCIPFPGPDKSVTMRSQYYFYKEDHQRPIQIQTYISFPSLLTIFCVCFVGLLLLVLSPFQFGRDLLLKYPRLFSLGGLSHEGPSEDAAENTVFSLILKGKCWKERLAEATDQFAELPNKKMVVKVSGRNPAYGATCTMLLMCAFVILTESDKMPSSGGVYPPGAAFAKTSLIKQLNEHGVKFEVVISE